MAAEEAVNKNQFEPSEVWNVDDKLDEPIERARWEMNAKDTAQLVDSLRHKLQRSDKGVAYAVLDGDRPQDYSTTEAMVYFDSLSVGPSANRLVKAEFIREVAAHSDLEGARDTRGKLKPVILIASPGPGSDLRLNSEERKQIKKGDFGPAAAEYLRAISELGLGKIATLGFSKGSKDALAAVLVAGQANLDVDRTAVGEHPGTEKRNLGQLTSDFGKAGTKELEEAKARTGLAAQEASLNKRDMARFVAGLAKPINWTLIKGMRANTFEKEVQEILDRGLVERLVVGYGSESAIAKPQAIEPALNRLHQKYADERLFSIKVRDGNHAWGDQLPLLAKLYMRALV